MRRQLAYLVQDIKHGENLEHYILIVLAMTVAVLTILGIASSAAIASATLTVLSLMIYDQVKLRRILSHKHSDTNIHGITQFYPNRESLIPLEKVLSESKSEIAIMGLQLGAIIHSYLPLLRQRASQGCRIRLLMMSPVSKEAKPLPWVDEVGKVHTFISLSQILQSNISHLTNWLAELPDEVKTKIEVRLYGTIPTASVLLIDKDSDSGVIKVEPVLHQFPPHNRPSFVVERHSSLVLYSHMVDSFNSLWEMSIELSALSQTRSNPH